MGSIVKFENGCILLHNGWFKWEYNMILIGIRNMQGERPAPMYVGSLLYNHTVETRIMDNITALRIVHDSKKKWNGVPMELPHVDQYTDITDWLNYYCRYILMEAYAEYDKNIQFYDRDTISSEFNKYRILSNAVQFNGFVKLGKFNEFSPYSVDFCLNLMPLPRIPMIPRIGDRRIGYLYQEILHNGSGIFEEPYIHINRRNIETAPWVFVIEPTIDKRFWKPIIDGVTQWNLYFEYLKLGSPFVVLEPGNKLLPERVDIFDLDYNYIVDHSTLGLNAPYTGLSQDFTDFRSGEILMGNIYMHFERIETIGMRYFNLYQTKHYSQSEIEKAINNCITWIVGHEIGHQLGLRHNFVGNESDNGYGSIMDYVEFFDDFKKFIKQDYMRIRTYDLYAITYGYLPIKKERWGFKPAELDSIAQIEIPFKTDENFFSGLIPNVGRMEDEADPLAFIEKAINKYEKFRRVILEKLVNKQINSYQYANGFLFIYINRFYSLIHMLCRYIGGRYIDFHFYRKIKIRDHIKSLNLLLKMKHCLKYNQTEYNFLIYDFPEDINELQPMVITKMSEYYGFNAVDLFSTFQQLTDVFIDRLTFKKNLIRLNAGKQQYSFDLLYQFTFCVKRPNDHFDLDQHNGIFPEIGMLIIRDPGWKEQLATSDIFDQYTQYKWVQQMATIRNSRDHYFVIMVIDRIFSTILRHRDRITTTLVKMDNELLISHWNIIFELIRGGAADAVSKVPAS